MSDLQMLNLAGFLVGGTALAGAAMLVFARQDGMVWCLAQLSKWRVMSLFAVVATLLFLTVSVGAYAAIKAGDFVPQCYTTQPDVYGPLMQVAAVSAYLALEVITPAFFLFAGYAIDEARIVDSGKWTLAVIASLLLSFAPIAAYIALRSLCVH